MTHVIKISGYEADHPKSMQALANALSIAPGEVVLVHGGGSVLPKTLAAIGGGASNPLAADIAAMALRGGINPRLVAALIRRNIQAIGLCGVDLELMYIQPGEDEPIVRFEVLKYLLDQNWLPVIAPIALDLASGCGTVLNADLAAHMVASALGADELTFIINTPGVLSEGKRVTGISARQFDRYIKQGVIDESYASVVRAAAAAAPFVGTVRITDIPSLFSGVETLVVA
jgi:acetylglutamate kinase